ncbi:hypothetical protein EVAR_76849_1 [Eumeta japonica]|uniref:Nucleic-acid-binding protein from transposon X-element n=1 Tax=Eumeta variegata TaxID=151549 RepID=A0A4C1SHF0_EUMVA|nr:hypothetical protein EVAR_76849_1 [Eumeta japonica]
MSSVIYRASRCPVSALNGRATAPGKCVSCELLVLFSVCSVLQVCDAEPHSVVSHHHHRAGHRDPRLRGRAECCVHVVFRRASSRFAAYRTAPRVPRRPLIFQNYHTTRPASRAVVASHHLRCCGSVRHRPSTLAATAMDKSKLQAFLTERGHLDLLREFEAYCSSPASPDPQVVVFDPEMDLEYTLPRVSNKRSANARPSEGTSSDSDSDPGSSDSPDHSGFTTVRRRRAAKGSKPKAAGLTQTSDGSMCYRLTPAPRKPKKANVAKATPSGKSTSSIYASPVSWRTPSQPAAASQEAVGDGGVKAAAPAAAKNNRGDEADVTAPPTPAPRGPKPPPMFVQDKDRWTELRRRCADKGIQFSQARNSVQGLKLQAKTVADFKNLQNLLVCYKFKFHTYSLKEEREIRVVLRGVPKEIPVDEPRPTTRRLRPPSKSGAYAPSPASKRSSPANAPYRAVSQLPVLRALVPSLLPFCALKCLGDHGTAQCTRNKDTDGPPACVLCNRRAIRPTTLDARVLQRDPPPERPCRSSLRAQSRRHSVMLERRLDRVTPRPPQRTLLHPLTI